MEKCVQLAAALEHRKGPHLAVLHSSGHRRRMLLLALVLISRNLGLGAALVQVEPVVGGLCDLAAVGPLGRLLEVVKRGQTQILVKSLRLLKQRRILALLRAKLRKRQSMQEVALGSSLRQHFKSWRNAFNLQLAGQRVARRLLPQVFSAWRRCARVTVISARFHAKKVKLRCLNRWFSRRFGRTKEKLLVMRLNTWTAEKQRRLMFADGTKLVLQDSWDGKRILKEWRAATRTRRVAVRFNDRRQLRSRWRLWRGLGGSLYDQQKAARMYNELRLFRRFLYPWHGVAVGDRLAFETANLHRRVLLLRGCLLNWRYLCAKEQYLRAAAAPLLRLQSIRSLSKGLHHWQHLQRQHRAQWVWTCNFHVTEVMRGLWREWRLRAQQQISADALYQRALAVGCLDGWRDECWARRLCRQGRREAFGAWRRVAAVRRHVQFFRGQRMLRALAALRAAPEVLTAAVTRHCGQSQSTTDQSATALLLLSWQKWHAARQRVSALTEMSAAAAHAVVLHRKLKIWRLAAALANVIRSEPRRRLVAAWRSLQGSLQASLGHAIDCDERLADYYTLRARQIEVGAWQRWRLLFHAHQRHLLRCQAQLLAYQHTLKVDHLHLWQLATTARYFRKCQSLTGRQGFWQQWRQQTQAQVSERRRRQRRACWTQWRSVLKQSHLNGRMRRWVTSRTSGSYFSYWRQLTAWQRDLYARAIDAAHIASLARKLRLWRQRAAVRSSALQLLIKQHRIVLPSKSFPSSK